MNNNNQLPQCASTLSSTKNCQWYWGGITSSRAIRLLKDRPCGTFLVRDSHSDDSVFTISYKDDSKVYHTRIARHRGEYCLGGPKTLIHSTSIIDVIQQAINATCEENGYKLLMQPTESDPRTRFVELRFPLGRNQYLNSLKNWCRMTIQSHMDISQIDKLNLPTQLKLYLAESCFADVL